MDVESPPPKPTPSTGNSTGNIIYKNLANVVSILGVLPLCLLFVKGGYQYLLPLIVYNNIMDDLDGILAIKLNIKSRFGANLDNLCDAVTHIVFLMVVGTHFLGAQGWLDVVCATASLVAVTAIVIRVATRIDPTFVKSIGSPTNELIRHMLFVLLLAESFAFSPLPALIALFALHTVTMLVPFGMPHQIRSLTKSTSAIGLVNIALVVAWLVPCATPLIAGCFATTYLYSFLMEGIKWYRNAETAASSSVNPE